MGYIIHEIFHFLVGASFIYILTIKERDNIRKRIIYLLFGGIAAISPDITKFFGDIFGHSIWAASMFGLLVAVIFHFLHRDIPFVKSWGIFSLIVLVGHLFIDYIGNGVAFLYPIHKEEFSLSIIARTDEFIFFTLLAIVLIALVYRKGKMIVLTGLLLISLYIGGLIVSKLQLEHALKQQYEDNEIHLLLTYRSHQFLEWNFMLRSEKVWVSGYSPIVNKEIHIESERKIE